MSRASYTITQSMLIAVLLLSTVWTAHAITAPKPSGTSAQSAPTKTQANPAKGPLPVDWETLLPDKERAGFELDAPAPSHDYLNESGPRAKQAGSAATNAKLDNVAVKIPGFIVPMTMSKQGVVSEFFLVPYYGACIHVPPPPPNQIVYVKMNKGFKLSSMYDAQWVTGMLHVAAKETRMASAAYTLQGEKVEPYSY